MLCRSDGGRSGNTRTRWARRCPGAEGADGPPALGFGVPTTSKVMNWVSMLASSPSTGHQVVVGGVVAPAQGRVRRRHGRGHGRRDLRSSGEGSQQLHPIGPAVVDLDMCVGLVELTSGRTRRSRVRALPLRSDPAGGYKPLRDAVVLPVRSRRSTRKVLGCL
jgi:hypothetical protein